MIENRSGDTIPLTKKERKGFSPLETPFSKRKKETLN